MFGKVLTLAALMFGASDAIQITNQIKSTPALAQVNTATQCLALSEMFAENSKKNKKRNKKAAKKARKFAKKAAKKGKKHGKRGGKKLAEIDAEIETDGSDDEGDWSGSDYDSDEFEDDAKCTDRKDRRKKKGGRGAGNKKECPAFHEVREIFEFIDHNGDMVVTKDEFKSTLERFCAVEEHKEECNEEGFLAEALEFMEEVAHVAIAADKMGNNNEQLEAGEAVRFYIKHCGYPVREECPSEREFMKYVFHGVDQHGDGDGKITGPEWESAKTAFEEEHPEEFNDPEVQAFMGALEQAAGPYVHDDGAVTKDEAKKMFWEICALPLPEELLKHGLEEGEGKARGGKHGRKGGKGGKGGKRAAK